MNEYCTYEDLKNIRGIGTDEIDDDDLLKELCTNASRIWEQLTRGRKFYPAIATRYYDHPQDDATRLKLDEDLLAVTTLTTENGNTTISSSDYYLMCGDTYNLTPYNIISLKSSGTTTTFSFSGTEQKANIVVGTWGYHEDWNNAFVDSQDTVQNVTNISSSGTTLNVKNAKGVDINGLTPRFKVQQILRIDSEYLYVTGKTSATILTVRRGVNGSTAASHDNGTIIYVYQPMEDVFHNVRRLAKWFYQQKDTDADLDRPVVTDAGVTLLPSALPKDVVQAAARYRR